MITSLLISGRATRRKISGILRPTIKRRFPNARPSGGSKRVGIREFPLPSSNPSDWNLFHDRVEVQVASITTFLPSSDNNKGEYSGTARRPAVPTLLTPLQESELRRKQAEAQIRDAGERKVVFDADPSPDAEITREVIDPEVPLGVMDDEGNIIADPKGLGMAIGTSRRAVTPKERIIDAGHIEKCVTDVRELVGNLFNNR